MNPADPDLAGERSERRRSRLLDQSGAAVVASDLDGTIEIWSQGAEELYGWRADEVVGRDGIDVLVPPEGRATARANLASLFAAGRRVAERELVRKDGTRFFAQATTTLVYRGADGEDSGIVHVAIDVTPRVHAARELRGARDYLRAVADSMGEALCTLDVDGRVRYVNAAAEKALGWTLTELRGRRLHDSVHFRRPNGEPYPAEECPLIAAARSGETVQMDDDMFIRRDGSTFSVSYTSAPFESENGTRGLVVVFSDITERKAEQDRMRREIELLSQVRDLRDTLDEGRFVLHRSRSSIWPRGRSSRTSCSSGWSSATARCGRRQPSCRPPRSVASSGRSTAGSSSGRRSSRGQDAGSS